MAISAMNHFTVLTDDVPRTVHFYCNLLGLATARGRISDFPARGCMPATPRFCMSSAARRANNCGPASSTTWRSPRPDSPRRWPCSSRTTSSTRAGGRSRTGTWQVFLFDPNGARVELDFAADEVHRGA